MKSRSLVGWRRSVVSVFLLLGLFAAWDHWREKEIALLIGEPWEDMRQRSSAGIAAAIPGHFWGRLPKSDARLRFIDPQYGFITPRARYFTVTFESDESVSGVSLSPQIEPLLLDDTLKVVMNLQAQWRNAGWRPIRVKRDPPFADTCEWRARLRDINKGGTSYWQAGDKYQLMLVVNRFKDVKHPKEERYLITLELAAPWVKP